MCVCEVVCISLGMTRSEISETVSSALSPVSVGAQKSYMTPQCSWVLKKIRSVVLCNLKKVSRNV